MSGSTAGSLWSAEAAALAADGTLLGPDDWAASGVEFDSRLIAPGDLFVALTGEARDGHEFVAKALDQGAAAALVSKIPEGLSQETPLLQVPDTLKGLEALGTVRRAEIDGKVCAVTGSVGKTGTKEMLRMALSRFGETHAPVKSFNNHIGVPLTLARMPRTAQYGVFEIGMNHPGEITPLTKMVRPHVAIITTVAPVHIEFFESLDAIAEAKAEIFKGLEPGGAVVLNRDQEHFPLLKTRAQADGAKTIIGCGASPKADAELLVLDMDETGSLIQADILGTQVTYRLGAPGRHLAQNSLAVLAAVSLLGADVKEAADALCEVRAAEGRGRRYDLHLPGGGEFTLIDESYNANPASMGAALSTLGSLKPGQGGRRIAVLGDMLELGDHSPKLHESLAAAIEQAGVDLVFCSGPMMRHLWDALPPEKRGAHALTSNMLHVPLGDAIQAGDIVTVKGSLGSAMRPIVDELLAKHDKQDSRAEAMGAGSSGESQVRC